MTAILVTTDLMATSTAHGAASQAGVELKTVSPNAAAEAANEATQLIALDLTANVADLAAWAASIRIVAPNATLLAYGPHVHEARLDSARESGFDLVVSRGQFHQKVADLLRTYAAFGVSDLVEWLTIDLASHDEVRRDARAIEVGGEEAH